MFSPKSLMQHSRSACTIAMLLLVFSAPPASAKTSDFLSLVPEDAVIVGMVRLSDMRSSPVTSRLFQETDRMTVDGDVARFMKETGLSPAKDVDTVVVTFSPSRNNSSQKGRGLVRFEGRFSPEKLGTAITGRGAVAKSTRGGTYYRLEKDHGESKDHEVGAVAFVDRSMMLAGDESSVIDALAALADGGTRFTGAAGLARELYRIDMASTAWMLVDVPRFQRFSGAHIPKETASEVFRTALRTVSTIAISASATESELRFSGVAVSSDPETRSNLEDLLRGMTAAWRMAAQEKHPQLVSIIRKFEVTNASDSVSISGKVPAAIINDLAKKSGTRTK